VDRQLSLFKQCGDCKRWKAATTNYFYKSADKRDGLNTYCKQCYKDHRSKDNYQRTKESQKRYKEKNKERDAAYFSHRWRTDKLRRLRYYKTQAKKRNIDYALVLDDIYELWGQPCHYCGVVSEHKDLIGIDRVDSSGPYHRDNIVPCCAPCNKAKGTKSYEDFHDVDKQ